MIEDVSTARLGMILQEQVDLTHDKTRAFIIGGKSSNIDVNAAAVFGASLSFFAQLPDELDDLNYKHVAAKCDGMYYLQRRKK